MPYQLVGLNSEVDGFESLVMTKEDLGAIYEHEYVAVAAYPKTVAEGLGEGPKMRFFERDSQTVLHSDNHNLRFRQISGLKTLLAWLLLPSKYQFEDSCVHNDPVGPNTVTITTTAVKSKDFIRRLFAKSLLATQNRPGVFLKIRNAEGAFYSDMFIFFPDKAQGLSHRPVKDGEFFVLLEQNAQFTVDREDAVRVFYQNYVNEKYGEDNGAYEFDHKSRVI